MPRQFFLHTICRVCLLCFTCASTVRDIVCTVDNFDNCTKYGNAKCATNNCRCMDNYYDDGSTCQKNKRKVVFNCHDPEPTCACSIQQYCRHLNCYHKKSADLTCNANNECLSPMTCKGGTCQCALDQYWTGSTCSAEKSVNGTCTANIECAPILTCSSGRCQCSTNQYWTGSACAAQKSVSVKCSANNECLRPMTCAGGTCECAINQRWTGSTCVALFGVPTSVSLSTASRSILISWNKPVDSKSTIIGYRVRVLVNHECVVEILLVCSTGCTNVMIQHMCSAEKRQIRENRRNTELMEPMSYEINKLLPYTAYNVWLNAINDAGNGNRSVSLVTTDSEVPEKPVNVAASVISSSEIKVTWKLPGPKPGMTTYYIKVYEMVINAQPVFLRGENVTGFNKQIAEFSGLEAFWNYTFTVVATTDKGSSEESDMSAIVTTYQDAPGKVTNFVIKRPSTISTTMEVSWSIPLLKDRNGIIKEYTINHNISGITTTETIAAEYEHFQKLYYITPDRHYQIEIYAVNAINQAGEKLRKMYYASSAIESPPKVSSKGYTIGTVVGAAVGCVVFSGIVVGLVCCLIRKLRRNIISKQAKAKHTREESKIGCQYEEVGLDNVSAQQQLGIEDNQNVYDQIDKIPTVDKQYENMII